MTCCDGLTAKGGGRDLDVLSRSVLTPPQGSRDV